MLDFESAYKKPGNTLFKWVFGEDPFDFWAGRFYVGFFGVVSVVAIALGVAVLFVAVGQYGDWDLWRANIPPPTRSFGLGWAPFLQGGAWQAVVLLATISFVAWGLREVDICRKLEIGFHVPAMFSLAISAWIILQILRPLLLGCWCEGFDLSFTGHLTWVSNTGFRYMNFYLNPFHAYAVLGFFLTAMVLAMHGSAILGTYNTDKDPNVEMRREDSFWRDYIGYSIGEYGIHRLGFYLAVFTLIMSDLCILNQRNAGKGLGRLLAPLLMALILPPIAEPIEEFEPSSQDGGDSLGIRLGEPTRFDWFRDLKVDTQIGTIWLGTWGVLSVMLFVAATGVAILAGMDQVNGSPLLFVKYLANLRVSPPDGLGMAPSLRDGGYWQIITLFLAGSTLAWAGRCYERLVRHQWRPFLLFAFLSAILLTATIWVFHPILVGSWADAPGLGLNSDLSWAQNFSVLRGNLYYNPFHQLAIFFLFGSTMLWGMHGATILATGAEGSHHEDIEIKSMSSGSEKAALFWRWTMGFNAFPKSIHDWLWWFAVGTVLASAVGILMTGVMTNDWYVWGVDHGTVAQYGPMTRSAVNQYPRPMPVPADGSGYMPAPGR